MGAAMKRPSDSGLPSLGLGQHVLGQGSGIDDCPHAGETACAATREGFRIRRGAMSDPCR